MTLPSAARLIEERRFALISFDLDDTLIDTDGAAPGRIEAAVRRAVEVLGDVDEVRLEAARARALEADPVTVGRIVAFFDALDLPVDDPRAVAIREAYNGALQPEAVAWVPGAREVLLRLRDRFTLAIVTNGPTEMQRPKVAAFGLESLVDHIVISGEVGIRKPEPGIFRHLLGLAGLEPAEAVHVGDSLQTDVGGAHAAGMAAIWFPPRHRVPESLSEAGPTPDAVLHDLADLG